MARGEISWVVMGGKPGEAAHCTRCGAALGLTMPCEMDVFLAATKAFLNTHQKCVEGQQPAEPLPLTPSAWMQGRDTGVSSATICAVLARIPSRYAPRFDVPRDPSDFGRCYRLLEQFPEFLARLGEVAATFPWWGPIVREWDWLTKLYDRDYKKGHSTELYMALRRLGEEGRAMCA